MKRDYEFDIALSFASEQRWYVDVVARTLTDYGVSVFYDMFESPRLWGKDGIETLSMLYRDKAFKVVIFVSADYVQKGWPTVERRAALSRLLAEPSSEHILPVRFDDAEVPGLPQQTIFQRARDFTPVELGELIVEHLIEEARISPDAKKKAGAAAAQARLVSFTSTSGRVAGTTWRIDYRLHNGSSSTIDSVVLAVPDHGRAPQPSADDQRGCALELVIGAVGAGQTIEDHTEVELLEDPAFEEIPYVATLLWSDREGNHWAARGSELRRRAGRARTC